VKTLNLIFFFFICTIGHSQVAVDSIIVKASILESTIAKSGRSVSVIDAELQTHGANSIDELLRQAPGLNVNSRYGYGVQSDIGIRASTFSQVLVLIDGQRLNDGLTAHFNSNIPIPISEIERIEIVRGPAAAAFGSDAIGGMINVITKTSIGKGKEGLSSSGEIYIGEYGLLALDAGIRHKGDNIQLGLSFKNNGSKGERRENPNFPSVGSAPEHYNQYFTLQNISGSLSGDLGSNLKLTARLSYDYRDFDAKHFYTRSTFDESAEQTSAIWSQAELAHTGNGHSTNLSARFKSNDDYFLFNPMFPANDHNTKGKGLRLNHSRTLSNSVDMALGVEFDVRSIESTDRGNHSDNRKSAFMSLAARLGPEFNTNFGLRYVSDENFGNEVVPQLAFAYVKPSYAIRASMGGAVRGADYTERYISSQISNLSPGRNIGNPDLKAEKSTSYDVGLFVGDKSSLSFDLGAFYRDSKDLIDYVLTNESQIANASNLQAGEDYFYTMNVSESSAAGLESSIQSRLPLLDISEDKGGGELLSTLTYTFQKTSHNGNEVSKYLANHPAHQLNLSSTLSYNNLGGGIQVQYIGRDPDAAQAINARLEKSYAVVNLNTSYTIIKGLRAKARVQNLFNEQYQDILGSRMPSRWLSLGAQWEVSQ